jgi:hypothetical protein
MEISPDKLYAAAAAASAAKSLDTKQWIPVGAALPGRPNFLFLSPFYVKNFQLDPQKT